MYLNNFFKVTITTTTVLSCLFTTALLGMLNNSVLADDVTVLQPNATANEIIKGFIGEPKRAQRTRMVIQMNNKASTTSIPSSPPSNPPAAQVETSAPKTNCSTGKSVAIAIQFGHKSDDLTPEARATLDQVAKAMINSDLVSCLFSVEGHTDAKGKFSYNMSLSLLRAKAVKKYLKKKGVKSFRLQEQGKGPTSPLDPKNPYADENRRVQFKILGG